VVATATVDGIPEYKKRRQKKSAADPEHARYKTDDASQPDDDQPMD